MEKELKAIAAEHLVEMYPTDQEAKDNNVHLYEYIEDKNNYFKVKDSSKP